MSMSSTSIAIVSSSAERGRRNPAGRLALLALASLLGIGVWLAGTLVTLPSARARRLVRTGAFRRWARVVCRLLGVRLEVLGAVPAAPFYLVSNHLSYLDIVVFAAIMPARFVAKREVRGWPVVGLLARAMATIFVDRTAHRDALRVQEDLAQAVRDGDGVIVFAEATSTPGREVLPFRPALLEWAARTVHPVHYASLAYRTGTGDPPAHLAVCWWGDMTFGRHLVDLCRLQQIEAQVRLGAETIADPDRKRLAERLYQAVSAQFTPVVMEQG